VVSYQKSGHLTVEYEDGDREDFDVDRISTMIAAAQNSIRGNSGSLTRSPVTDTEEESGSSDDSCGGRSSAYGVPKGFEFDFQCKTTFPGIQLRHPFALYYTDYLFRSQAG
jgi:hypothetical protein